MKTSRLILSWLISLALILVSVTVTAAQSNDCAQTWTWSHSLEFPPGFWEAGPHNYDFHILSPYGEDNFHIEFQSTVDAPLYDSQVRLRLDALQPGDLTEINPEQDTVLQLTFGFYQTREEAVTFRQATTFQARWDGGAWVDIPAGPITKTCAFLHSRLHRSWGPNY